MMTFKSSRFASHRVGVLLLLALVMLFSQPFLLSAVGQETREIQGLGELQKLSEQLVSVSQRCVDSTVAVISANANGAGSGVVVDEHGLILTAAHVIAATGDEVFIIFGDGTRRKGMCLGADFDRDAAMIQLERKPGDVFPFATVAQQDLSEINEWCFSVGHPGGFDPTRTAPLRLGRILSTGRFVTTDCAIVGGDSGGPLFDTSGRVIGIHSNIGASLSENRHVPISAFHEYWANMKDRQRRGRRFAGNSGADPNRPILGTRLADETGDRGGVEIVGVFEDSPAQAAGLRIGDEITSINDERVKSRDELIDAVGQFKVGDKVTVSLVRDGDTRRIEVTLGRLADLARPGAGGQSGNRQRPPVDDLNKRPDGDSEDFRNDSSDECLFRAPASPVRLQSANSKTELDRNEVKEDSSDKALDLFIDDVLSGGGSKIDAEAVKRFGSMTRILQRLKQRVRDRISIPRERATLREHSRNQIVSDEFFQSCLDALEPVTLKAAESTVEVLIDGEPVILGTVVSSTGLIVTKDTETRSGAISVRLSDGIVTADLVQRFSTRDLAVIKVDRNNLQAVDWLPAGHPALLGSLLTAADQDGEPLGIGLVSVLPRTLSKVGYLGIQTGFAAGGGVLVGDVSSGSAADKGGLQPGDIIRQLNGKLIESPIDFSYQIQRHRAGDKVEIGYSRGDRDDKLVATLGARSVGGGGSARSRRMNEMSGPLSERDSGFPEALQHDIPLLPSDCGGPLMDLEGRCIGINVSRAGRVKTYAIPADDVQAILTEILTN